MVGLRIILNREFGFAPGLLINPSIIGIGLGNDFENPSIMYMVLRISRLMKY